MPFRIALIAFTALTLGACFSKSDDDDDDDDWGDDDSGDSWSNGSGSGGQGGSGSGSGGGEGSGAGGEGSGGEGSGSGGEGSGSGGEGSGSSGGSSDGDSYTGPPVGTPIDGVLQSDAGGWTSAMTGEVVPCSDCTWGFEAALPDIDFDSILWTIRWQGGDDVTLYYQYLPLTDGVIATPGYIRWEGGGYSGYIRY